MGFFGALIPAIAIVVVVLVLEEIAVFRARTKFQRALITGVTVFVLLGVINLVAGPTR